MTDEQETALATKDGALRGAAVSAAVAAAVYGALRGAAVSAAVAAAVYGLRKAVAAQAERDEDETSGKNGHARSGPLLIMALESASDHVLPLAEAAAEEAGRWVARNSPEVVRDRLLPRFIDAFNAAA